MNDFTKEELTRILEGVSWWLDGDQYLPSLALIEKIQSMIDNYCEHHGEIGKDYPVEKGMKLSEILKNLKEYEQDKTLSSKCGVPVKELCGHHSDGSIYFKNSDGESHLTSIAKGNGFYKCKKCGECYK